VKKVVEVVETTTPADHGLPGYGWTLKKLREWVSRQMNRVLSKSTFHAMLRAAGMSWKKCKKLLGKANPEKRQAFLDRFGALYDRVRTKEVVLVYIDEAHLHRDLDLGYTWGRVGARVWRVTDCPPLKERVNWYGAYNFTDGQCLIWAEGACNTENTIRFLHKLDEWLRTDPRRVVVVWDGAPWHRAKLIQRTAEELGIELVALPGYSPDLNPIEGLWKWMREAVTQLKCYQSVTKLFEACLAFIEEINKDPAGIIRRLWPRFELDPEIEKLRVST
jgi:transposase